MNYPIEFKLGNYILRMYEDLSVTKYKKNLEDYLKCGSL